MPYLPNLNSFLHQTSLLLEAYPSTRITTKYSLPRQNKPSESRQIQPSRQPQHDSPMPDAPPPKTNSNSQTTATAAMELTREKLPPAATLTVKAYHPASGICLKYKTDKAQEVGRLIGGLGRLAKGDIIEEPSTAQLAPGIVEDVEEQPPPPPPPPQTQGKQPGGGGGGGKKKKKGKR